MEYKRDAEMIYDPPVSDKNVQVIDVDCQGLFNLNARIMSRMTAEHPDVVKKYRELCFKQGLVTGDVIQLDDKGVKFLLLVTTYQVLGKYKDEKTEMLYGFKDCLKELVKNYKDYNFHSGIILRLTGLWGDINKDIETNKLNWSIYPS